MDGEMSALELEGRLVAQRRVLAWLLDRLVTDPETFAALETALGEDSPPLDHQEDPGAVPSKGFATLAAGTAELRLLLDPLRAKLG